MPLHDEKSEEKYKKDNIIYELPLNSILYLNFLTNN